MGRTLSDINHNNILYDPPSQKMETKRKINKCLLKINNKLKSFCTIKETISKDKSPQIGENNRKQNN